MLPKTFIQSIIKTVSKYDNIVLCYLFGSSIESDEYNDIDLGLFLSNSSQIYDVTKFSMEIGRLIEKALNFQKVIDVKILNHSPIYFQFEVISKGVLVYLKSEKERISYEKEVISLYLDYKDTLDWFNTQILERG